MELNTTINKTIYRNDPEQAAVIGWLSPNAVTSGDKSAEFVIYDGRTFQFVDGLNVEYRVMVLNKNMLGVSYLNAEVTVKGKKVVFTTSYQKSEAFVFPLAAAQLRVTALRQMNKLTARLVVTLKAV